MIVINDKLLAEFRQARRCERCGKSTPGGCDPHHIFPRGLGGGHRLDIRENLISLCRQCHMAAPGERDECLALVAIREKITVDDIKEKVWSLKRDRKCKVWIVD